MKVQTFVTFNGNTFEIHPFYRLTSQLPVNRSEDKVYRREKTGRVCVLVTFNVVFLEPRQTVLSSTFEKIQISNISLKFNTDDLLGSEIHGKKRHFVLTFCCLSLD